MKFYPLNLNIRNKLCIVIGGGNVAGRKIKNIIAAGGCVKVISPSLSDDLKKLAAKQTISYINDNYHNHHLKDAFLVFAATNNKEINNQIAAEASEKNILVNNCTSAEHSSFIVPAAFTQKGKTITVSSNGKSPKAAVNLKNKLKTYLSTHE